MSEEKWGAGNAKDAKAFTTARLRGGEEVELFFGEHPHSRQDNSIYARTKSCGIVGFDGHRAPLKIEIEEYNYLKSSGLSGDEIRKGCSVKVYCDGVQVFDEFHRNYQDGYRIAHQFIVDMEMHWGWFPKQTSEWQNRIVAYKNQLFKIDSFVVSQSCMMLETLDGKPRKPWPFEDKEDYELESNIKVEITSPHINWFPKD